MTQFIIGERMISIKIRSIWVLKISGYLFVSTTGDHLEVRSRTIPDKSNRRKCFPRGILTYPVPGLVYFPVPFYSCTCAYNGHERYETLGINTIMVSLSHACFGLYVMDFEADSIKDISHLQVHKFQSSRHIIRLYKVTDVD